MGSFFKVSFTRPWVIFGSIPLIGFFLYAQTLFYDLTYLDDNVWILDFRWFLKDISNIGKIFFNPEMAVSRIFYRPIISLSFILDTQLAGGALWMYHLTNIGIHILGTCLVFLLFRKLRYSVETSFGVALLFMAHPVLTQAVAWIPGRTDSLLGVFTLGALICFLSLLEKKQRIYYVGHIGLWTAAFLTKETAIVLPGVCFMYYCLIGYRTKSSCDGAFSIKRGCALWCGWGIILLLWRWNILGGHQGVGILEAVVSVWENLPTVILYFGKAIFPLNLSVLPVRQDTRFIFGFLAIVFVSVALFFSRQKRWAHIIFGLGWFFLFLLPSLVISFWEPEYRLYLPLIGVFIVILEIDMVKNLFKRPGGRYIFLGVLVMFAGITLVYSRQFKDRLTFWKSAVKSSPSSPLAHRNLGAMYYLDGRLEEARKAYEASLRQNPYEPMVHNNLGIIYMNQGLYALAEKEYLAEIKINPSYANVYFNLGILYYRQQQFEKAVALWKKTVALDPEYVMAYHNLVSYYTRQGDFKQANKYLKELRKRKVYLKSNEI